VEAMIAGDLEVRTLQEYHGGGAGE
jgi:hypothetical protein